jgi:hypothetical protein
MKQRSFIITILISMTMLQCSQKERSYETLFKRGFIEVNSIEPIVEYINIDTAIDSTTLKAYFSKKYENALTASTEEALDKYTTYQKKYSRSLKYDGKYIADGVYLEKLNRYKKDYEERANGIYPDWVGEFYKERLSSATRFEQVTIKYRLSKDGPLIVSKYRADIFNGDTALYNLEGTLGEYLKIAKLN